MKCIIKNIKNEPISLKELRSTPGATYDDCNKEDIRTELIKEQGRICAYCMRRISDKLNAYGQPKMTIEHYIPRSVDSSLALNYLNMLGVCKGGEKGPGHLRHCDKSRGNNPLVIDPRKKNCEDLIKYTPRGEVYSDDERINYDLDNTLNLNIRSLKDGRATAIELSRQILKSFSKGAIQNKIKELESLNKKGQYAEFCQAAIYYLQKKLRQL